MKKENIISLLQQFEDVSLIYDNIECWSARNLQILLGYSKWENFVKVLDKAKVACMNAGEKVTDHFPDVRKMISLAKGAEREVDDMLLTRYACYLIAQNGDSKKEQVAFIRSKGDQALFKLSTALLKKKLGVPSGRPLADFLPTISIKAKDLATEMTSINVQTKDLQNYPLIEKEHVDNNSAVRNMLVKRGIHPETLPPAEDVKKVQKRWHKESKEALKKENKK